MADYIVEGGMWDDSNRLILAKHKQGKLTTFEQAESFLRWRALPIALGVYLAAHLRRLVRASRKASANKAKAETTTEATSTTAPLRLPRYDYKVPRDQMGPMLFLDDTDDGPLVTADEGDDTMEAYDEDEVDQAGAAAAGGAPPNQMIEMLKSMGFRMVVDKASGQIYMVPPGAKAPNEQGGIPEGDEGGDEDEDEQ